jgi:hypothetical protein
MTDKPASRITEHKEHVYERVNQRTGQTSIQIGRDKIASAKLDDQGRPTIEVWEQTRNRTEFLGPKSA